MGAFKHRRLFEPAVVRRPIRSPANETRRVPEPAVAVKDGVRHLTDRGRRDATPGRHGGVLPSRSDRALLGSSVSLRTNPPAVVLEELLVPGVYKRVMTTISVDKRLILETFKNTSEVVPDMEVSRGQRVDIE